ncbi:MAG: DeoR/GlpR family DNA-binding transcription regulator [Spirochaetales bacterium]|nr:DeoR/GlpR family DNA-binding transcription regulator [Spirochaetales bacterium]
MTSTERKKAILERVSRNKSIQITDLVEQFDVSVMTIRRDLAELEEKKYITRVYGGAVLNEEELNKPYFPRAEINSDIKDKIAKKASELVKEDDTLILDLGTTVLQVSKYLGGKKGISVVTCSIPVINELEKYPNVNVFSLGGELKRDNHAFLGSGTEKEIEKYCADIAFIGCAGISFEFGLTNFYHQTAYLCSKIIKQSKKVILLADSSKFGKAKSAVVGKLTDIDALITDDGIPKEYLEFFERSGVDVITVENKKID